MSRLTPIYTIHGLLSTTPGLGVRYIGLASQTVGVNRIRQGPVLKTLPYLVN
jgi:hypothetical protein